MLDATDLDDIRHPVEPGESSHERNGVWIKRHSLSVGSKQSMAINTDDGLATTDLPITEIETETGTSEALNPLLSPSKGPITVNSLAAEIKAEFHALHAEVLDLRREMRSLYSDRQK